MIPAGALSAPVAPGVGTPRVQRLLATLTPIEQRDFLPPEMDASLRGMAEHIVVADVSAFTDRQWRDFLFEQDPEVLIACWKTPLLPAQLPPSLRYVCYLAGTVKKLVTREHIESGLLVTNWGGSIARVVAEWGLFHILSCLRRATFWTLAMHTEGAWKSPVTETASLFGRRVGIHGFGMVARELVPLLKPFGTQISVHAPDVDAAVEKRFGVRAVPSLDALFRDNDIIIELAPLIPATENCVTERHLRLIRPGGVFVNIGRGGVVEQEGLLRVAREGKVLFGIDVFVEEPLPPDSPLRGLRNVCLTPHLAGPTTDRRKDATAFALRNLAAYVAGAPMEAVITAPIFDAST
jgi:phosphoglycerate dehydrogenase-like enzyme